MAPRLAPREEGGKYHVILADPPWQYRVLRPGMKVRESGPYNSLAWFGVPSYAQMPLDAIKALPIRGLAARDCALFLWVTMPCLPEGLAVMAAWGFTYRCVAFTWIKTNRSTGRLHMGLGHYTRGNAELCLLGTRGKMRRKAVDVEQIIVSSKRQHSRKPDETYGRIERLFDGPYVELFARSRPPGWDTAFSNQAGRFPFQPSLTAIVDRPTKIGVL